MGWGKAQPKLGRGKKPQSPAKTVRQERQDRSQRSGSAIQKQIEKGKKW